MVLTSYSIAYRIQNVALLLAITVGSAIAILTSPERTEGNKIEEKLIKRAGLGFFVVCDCFRMCLFF